MVDGDHYLARHECMTADWEAAWAACDDNTYRFVIDRIEPEDVVLDIGAGDLRLARRLAQAARRVYAIERNPDVLAQVDRSGWPANLMVVCGDALTWQFPPDVTVGVLLMRHCARDHFAEYAARLRAAGCRRLITNARWKIDVEEINLQAGSAYDPERMGWYACACGSIGFTPGDPAAITSSMLGEVSEVVACPKCRT